MKILLTGANGQLGNSIREISKRNNAKIYAFSKNELDITDEKQIFTVVEEIKPNFIINAAAYTNVDNSENNPDQAFSINQYGVRKIGMASKDCNIPLIHLSTDFVFDGENQDGYLEDDKKNPINSNNYNVPLIENNHIIERPVDQTTITKRFSEKVVEKIKEMKDDKFFIYLSHSMPHIPIYASDDFIRKSKAGLYGDVIEEIDHGVGIIMNELRKNNLDKNTIVVFSSDNGPWLPFKTHGGSAGLLREGKGMTWEGGQRVPGIFWGADIKPGVIDQIGSTMDLLPTILDFTNSESITDRVIDGVSIKQTLLNHSPSKRDKIIFYREREVYAIRYGKYKAHFIIKGAYNYPPGSNEKIVLDTPLLFNLDEDPSEKHNIAEKYPEKVEEIKLIALNHINSFNPPESLLESRNSEKF